jgi:hypothetical protein
MNSYEKRALLRMKVSRDRHPTTYGPVTTKTSAGSAPSREWKVPNEAARITLNETEWEALRCVEPAPVAALMSTRHEADPAGQSNEPMETVESVWEWLGGYVAKLEPVVETYLDSGADKDARIHAFNKLDKYRREASEGRWKDSVARSYSETEELVRGHRRRDYGLGGFLAHETEETSLTRLRTGKSGVKGGATLRVERARDCLRHLAETEGETIETVLAEMPGRGRPSKEKAERQAATKAKLQQWIRAAREAGHAQADIAKVLDLEPRYVGKLAA